MNELKYRELKVKFPTEENMTLGQLCSLAHIQNYISLENTNEKDLEIYHDAISDICGVGQVLTKAFDDQHTEILNNAKKLHINCYLYFNDCFENQLIPEVKMGDKTYEVLKPANIPAIYMMKHLLDSTYAKYFEFAKEENLHNIWLLIPKVVARLCWHKGENIKQDYRNLILKENEMLDMKMTDACKVFAFFLGTRPRYLITQTTNILKRKQEKHLNTEKSTPKGGVGQGTSRKLFRKARKK